MKVVMSSGHGMHVRGAHGFIDEVNEARKVVDQTAKEFRLLGVEIVTYHDDVSKTQSENLKRIVDFHNSKTRDLDVSVHFNASKTTTKPVGTECLYVTQNELAVKVSAAIAACGFINRGSKYRKQLYFLNQTSEPSILIEVCFVDSSADVEIYHREFGQICKAIASSVSGRAAPVRPRVLPPVAQLFDNITATVFGGESDLNNSAYDGKPLNDTDLYVALPFKFKGKRSKVQVWFGDAVGVASIEDVGPWMIDDDYWAKPARPIAEECYAHKKPLPSGPNAGKVPTNDAGIDLSPALARLIGLEGKGKVKWGFYEEDEGTV